MVGDRGKKRVHKEEKPFDPSSIPTRKWQTEVTKPQTMEPELRETVSIV